MNETRYYNQLKETDLLDLEKIAVQIQQLLETKDVMNNGLWIMEVQSLVLLLKNDIHLLSTCAGDLETIIEEMQNRSELICVLRNSQAINESEKTVQQFFSNVA